MVSQTIDDDSSTVSTGNAVRSDVSAEGKCHVRSTSSTCNRRVTFQTDRNTVHGSSQLRTFDFFKEDVRDVCWYNAEDYRSFRSENAAVVIRSNHQEVLKAHFTTTTYVQTIDRLFYGACRPECIPSCITTLSSGTTGTGTLSFTINDADCIRLSTYLNTDTITMDRFGLEKRISRQIAREQRILRIALTQGVMKVQATPALSQSFPGEHISKEKRLRALSERISQPSRLYALNIGVAVALAVRSEAVDTYT